MSFGVFRPYYIAYPKPQPTALSTLTFFVPPVGGKIKVWDGIEWVEKPVKVWTGGAWVEKPLKVWNGGAWVLA